MLTFLKIQSTRQNELIDITARVESAVDQSGQREGFVILQSLHTTAALTINENADPDVQVDLLAKMGRLAPREESYYRHLEGNSDGHVKTSLFGPSLTVLVHEGKLLLGTWQGIYFCEWDGPRERQVAVRVVATE